MMTLEIVPPAGSASFADWEALGVQLLGIAAGCGAATG